MSNTAEVHDLRRQPGLHRGTVVDRGTMVEWFRALDLKSGGPGSNLPPYCYLDLFLVVPRSTASHQLGYLIVYVLFEIFSFLLIGSPISTTVLTTYDTEMKLLLSSSSSSLLLLLLLLLLSLLLFWMLPTFITSLTSTDPNYFEKATFGFHQSCDQN